MWVDLRSLWESSGSPDVTVALTGVEGTGAVGSVALSITASLSGNAGTGSVGSVAITNSLALVGAGGTGSVGTVAPQSSLALPGSSATGSVGSVALSFDLALTGNEGTSAVGTISVPGDVTVALTGTAATAQVGNVSITAASAEASQSGGGRYFGYIPETKKKKKPFIEVGIDKAGEQYQVKYFSAPLQPFLPIELMMSFEDIVLRNEASKKAILAKLEEIEEEEDIKFIVRYLQ